MIDPNFKFTEDHVWYIWCATSLYVMPVFVPTEAMYNHLINPKNHKSLIWTTLGWYSPLEWWRKLLESVLDEVKGRKLTQEAIGKLKTVFILHRPYQIDPRTKLLICGSYADLWETIDDYPPSLAVTKELMDYINLINLHDREKPQANTTCISHGNLPSQWQPVSTQEQEVGESSTQVNFERQFAAMNFEANPMEIEPSENLDEEDFWQYESRHSASYFTEEYLSDQNLSPSHEPIFKD